MDLTEFGFSLDQVDKPMILCQPQLYNQFYGSINVKESTFCSYCKHTLRVKSQGQLGMSSNIISADDVFSFHSNKIID
jgi:hypothetical protein